MRSSGRSERTMSFLVKHSSARACDVHVAVSKAKVEYGSMSYGLRERERNLLCMGGFKRWRWPITGKENAGDGGRFSFRPDLLNKNLIVINIKRK